MSGDILSVNTLSLSKFYTDKLPFSVCWISATNGGNSDNLNFHNHHHAFFELHIVIEGAMDYGVNGKNIALENGGFMLVPPNYAHRVIHCGDGFVKLTVAFNLKDEGGEYAKKLCQKPRFGRMDVDMRRDLDGLISSASHKGNYRALLSGLMATSLVLRAIEDVGVPYSSAASEGCDDRVIKVKVLIEDNTDIFFTCEELAGYCRISAKQLGRLFKKYEGVGLLEYIHRQKVETAKRMLSELDLPQKRIAELLGFSDWRYFSKFFLRTTGMTVAEYKAKENNNGTGQA